MKKERSHLGTLAMMTILAHTMAAEAYDGEPMRPHLQNRVLRPEGYGVHLSKAERKGKTPEQLQAMRLARKQEG